MRSTLLLVLLGAIAAVAQNLSVEGVAVNGQTGEPMAGVHVRLTAVGSDGITALYGAMSGPDGRFSITGIAPGTYYYGAELRGYTYAPPPASRPMLRLKAGEKVTDLTITMLRRAVITGRVLDRYGDPVPLASVQARPAGPAATHAPSSIGMYMQADERGEYRLTVPPGRTATTSN